MKVHGQWQTPSTGLRHPSEEGAGKRCSECGAGGRIQNPSLLTIACQHQVLNERMSCSYSLTVLFVCSCFLLCFLFAIMEQI